MYIILSNDWPNIEPRFSSTPTTVIGSPRTLTVLPMGSWPAKNFSRTSAPMTATIAAVSYSCWRKKRPSSIVLSSMSCMFGVQPCICTPNSSSPFCLISIWFMSCAPTSSQATQCSRTHS